MSEGDVDLVIVGAGAAGLTAGIFARRRAAELGADLKIVALDGAPKIGAKILISGGGRCNVTNERVRAEDFNGGSRNTIARILRTFPVDATVGFFRELGVELKREEGGKLFPTSERAATVLQALLGEARDVRPGYRVSAVERGESFAVSTSGGDIRARSIILATGGRSVPATGSDGIGYELAKSLGHAVTATIPALVPLLLDGHWLTTLSGISLDVELLLMAPGGHVLRKDRGSLLLTHFGLSGPVALDISRHWIALHPAELRANLLPDLSFADVERLLASRPRATMQSTLESRFPARFAEALLAAAGVPKETRGSELKRESRRSLAHGLTGLPLPVSGTRGFNYAEVTAGGVPLDEVDPRTMASRRCAGLFLCGEILDVDGRIGGFNFQWAWASGRLAGIAAVNSLVSDPGA